MGLLGLTSMAKRSLTESNIIIGVIHAGAQPESESFSDEGLRPPLGNGRAFAKSRRISLGISAPIMSIFLINQVFIKYTNHIHYIPLQIMANVHYG